ncbi:zinc finger domain-containing protein [Streptomyces sp. NBC_01237]|uniref:zinc finger domain-containing protein n=1 Tax=Streptomyces sp. NBC_01237 TaxID=2903790 RepID=UPI002DDAEB72|nr:hypothetical protein [Streptomyces sp. NBC_01237]WRZ73800.1 hypothetical protein OG251_20380 [Streptomyces sp. NBC_01237]
MNTQPPPRSASEAMRRALGPQVSGALARGIAQGQQRADIPPTAFGVSSEEAAANIKANVPLLAALAPTAEACTDPRHTGPIRAQLGCTGPDPAAEQPDYGPVPEAWPAWSALRSTLVRSVSSDDADRLITDYYRATIRRAQLTTAEQPVPRTERAYWQSIADALNAAQAAGMPVGIELDGTLTDHRAWSVVWNRDAERWTLTGYEGDEDQEQRSAWLTGAEAGEPAPITATADKPPRLDPFDEAAIRRAALLGGADAIEALPQDYECDPGRGDAVKLLRRLAGLTTTTEQPTGLTWEARADHAVRLYATTAIELEDARRENGRLRTKRDEATRDANRYAARIVTARDLHTQYIDSPHCAHDAEQWPCPTIAALDRDDQAEGPALLTVAELEQRQADADHLDTITALVDEIADDIPHHRAPQIAADYLNRHARLLAKQITTLGQARGWSTWAAALIHPDREFVDPGKDDDQAEQQLAVPTVGDRYEKRTAPDAGRIVTVNRVWVAESGRTAVAYDWRDDRPGQCGSACPLDVFHREYKAVEEQPLAFPQLAVPCPRCKAPAGQLCTSHNGTRQRTADTHQDRSRAYRRQQASR